MFADFLDGKWGGYIQICWQILKKDVWVFFVLSLWVTVGGDQGLVVYVVGWSRYQNRARGHASLPAC